MQNDIFINFWFNWYRIVVHKRVKNEFVVSLPMIEPIQKKRWRLLAYDSRKHRQELDLEDEDVLGQ